MASGALAYVERYGQADGMPVIYLHGAPGSPAEAELIAAAAAAQGIELWAIDRARLAPAAQGADYLAALAGLVAELSGGKRLPMIGFSIGAALALRVAARLKKEAGPLLLFSAAGPLDIPGAFEGMGAGAGVFRSARANGAGFALTVRGQAAMARFAPRLLRHLLFAGADASDQAFAATPEGRAILARIFASAWRGGGRAYRRDLVAYVEPWSHELSDITSPVSLWHGSADTWAPVAMARGLAERLPHAQLHVGGKGHYTTLIGEAATALAVTLR